MRVTPVFDVIIKVHADYLPHAITAIRSGGLMIDDLSVEISEPQNMHAFKKQWRARAVARVLPLEETSS